MVKDGTEQKAVPRESIGVVPTAFATRGPKSIPRVDYERIFVLGSQSTLLGEFALDDECPLEFADLVRSIPVSGMRHLVSFYQGEFAFTPFRVDDLWFVILTRGVPRIEERGSVGTLLAAARLYIPGMLDPALAKKEASLRAKEEDLEEREAELTRREQRAALIEAESRATASQLREIEADLRSREAELEALRNYAVQMQETLHPRPEERAKERDPNHPLVLGPP